MSFFSLNIIIRRFFHIACSYSLLNMETGILIISGVVVFRWIYYMVTEWALETEEIGLHELGLKKEHQRVPQELGTRPEISSDDFQKKILEEFRGN